MPEERRRAARGHTHEPYPCCGEPPEHPWGRAKGSICDDCKHLIAEGRRSEEARRASGMQGYGWTNAAHRWPGYYGRYDFDDRRDAGPDTRRELANRMWELVGAVSAPAQQGSTATDFVLECNDGRTPIYDGQVPVVMDPAVREGLNDLDAALRRALESVHRRGLRDGGSALIQLSHGNLTLDDFDRKTGQ